MIFTTPLLLFALLALPALWWLLRLLPPRPIKQIFPPLILMREINDETQTPNTSPWWLLLLRILLVTALILGFAEPLWRPVMSQTNAPLVILLDDGYAAAKNFTRLTQKADELIAEAARASRKIALVSTTRPPQALVFLTPQEAKNQLQALEPVSFAPNPLQVNRLFEANNETVHVSDGIDYDVKIQATKTYAQDLSPLSFITQVQPTLNGLTLIVKQTLPFEEIRKLTLQDDKGREILTQEIGLKGLVTQLSLELPREIRNAVAKLTLQGEGHVGAMHWLDQRQTRKSVALISGVRDETQPLLSASFYLEQALSGLADITHYKEATNEAVKAAIAANNRLIILSDVGTLSLASLDLLDDFMQQGGLLLRFASPRLTQDRLLPVTLLNQARQFGGTMTWASPKRIAPFAPTSLFYGLEIPQDISIIRQVLAEPDGELARKTLAQLEDGTPLITGEKRGAGLSLLFHVSSGVGWSDLPLSGLFTQILTRITALAGRTQAVQASEEAPLIPLKIFNGYGESVQREAKPLPPHFEGNSSAEYPAGLYGLAESPASVNVLYQGKVQVGGLSYQIEGAKPLAPFLLGAAFLFFLLDCGVMLRFSQVFMVLFLVLPLPLQAQEKGEMRLAFVQNGSSDDRVTLAGLKGLTRYIGNRTTLEPAEPLGLSLDKDELNLYPVLFWAMQPTTPRPSAKALLKLENYLKNGGLLVIDTADANQSGITPATRAMRNILGLLDIPPLAPVPENHVLGRSYYLLNQFPGRFSNGVTWIEALPTSDKQEEDRPARASDSVSPLILTNQDWLSAWAIDEAGRALLPLEGAPRQRDMAFRVGVNLVLYALTGNYKADQVHVPDLLSRLKGRQ
jgi:Domain of unknown function (DUF4159)/Aerotolerance regulator N-terminal